LDPLRAQQLATEVEGEMMADMYRRMNSAYHWKCAPMHYKEAELSKGKSVYLDCCVSKYLDIHEWIGKKLTELSMQNEELMKRMQQSSAPV
uniref:Mitochondrial import inner membrane translocase subunit n=1 Tax=Mustela putorius furo TaxID=9669 RepID=M3Z4V7_MUSPF